MIKNKILFIISQIVVLTLLTSCLSSLMVSPKIENPDTLEVVYQTTISREDQYTKSKWIYGPKYVFIEVYDTYTAPGGNGLLRLAIDTENNDILFYQLYVHDANKTWIFYDRAFDQDGNKLNFIPIAQDITQYSPYLTTETFAVNIKREYLDKLGDKDLNIKVLGKKGEKIFILPNFYVKGFLQKVDYFLQEK